MPMASHTKFGVWTFDVCYALAYALKFKLLKREVSFSITFLYQDLPVCFESWALSLHHC